MRTRRVAQNSTSVLQLGRNPVQPVTKRRHVVLAIDDGGRVVKVGVDEAGRVEHT